MKVALDQSYECLEVTPQWMLCNIEKPLGQQATVIGRGQAMAATPSSPSKQEAH